MNKKGLPCHSELRVSVIDDDEGVRAGIARLLESVGIRVDPYPDAMTFLEQAELAATGCIIADVRMPGLSGLQLHRRLLENGDSPPVILLTAHAETQMVAEEMKAGAFDFMDKPFPSERLLERVQEALRVESTRRRERLELDDVQRRLESLSRRERELLNRLVEGQSVKEIGYDLGISETTVHFHQRNLFAKMGVVNPVRLARLLDRFEVRRSGESRAQDRGQSDSGPA